MPNKYFITGIGTDVGKTVASAIITEALAADYWKPVQAGELETGDKHTIQSLISNNKTVIHPNAYALSNPESPHSSAKKDGITIDLNQIKEPQTTNNLVIEGAGGLLVPLNNTKTILDLIKPDYKVILVSRHYLGSINHTLMSIEILKAKGITTAGILYNGNEHTSTESIIKTMTNTPVIGRINEEVSGFDKALVKKYASKLKNSLLAL